MADYFIYNGPMERGRDLGVIKQIHAEKQSDECVMVLVTPGGDPDAAYKIGRYIQARYSSFKVLIPGICKSAGTLLAIAAEELIFAPYGELGPLDVQMAKQDHVAGLESGLNIGEAFIALEERAKETYHSLTAEIIGSSGGVVSYNTASHAATEIISSMYGPIFHRIDPEEVGSRSRAMRIGEDYGERLNAKWKNLKAQALNQLSRSYPSHGFVIDSIEAAALFERVRNANDDEMRLIEQLGNSARFPSSKLTFKKLADSTTTPVENSNAGEKSSRRREDAVDGTRGNGAHPGETEPNQRSKTRPKRASPARQQGQD